MSAEWSRLTLREAGVSLIDCEHRTPPAAPVGYPYVAIPQLKDGRIEVADARRISTKDFTEWTRKARPIANDIVLSRRCNPGETAFVPNGLEFALGQNLVLLRSDSTRIHPPFLRWLVRGDDWWNEIARFINVGAVFDSLKCADIPEFVLPLPPHQDQVAIATILNALDEKIELNRRMNETVEAIAREIFKSWFLDRDPVPNRADPKRTLPNGWAVGSLLNRALLLSGGTPKTDRPDYWDGQVLWASAKDVSQCPDAMLMKGERTITRKGLEESATQSIPEFCTVVVARGATTGRMVLFGREMAMNQTCYALQSKIGAPFFLYCQLRHEMSKLVHAAHGSVFDTITTTTFRESDVVLPPVPLVQEFEARVAPLFFRLRAGIEESGTLAKLRDSLLPKLLSGKIRLSQAEKAVEAAV